MTGRLCVFDAIVNLVNSARNPARNLRSRLGAGGHGRFRLNGKELAGRVDLCRPLGIQAESSVRSGSRLGRLS